MNASSTQGKSVSTSPEYKQYSQDCSKARALLRVDLSLLAARHKPGQLVAKVLVFIVPLAFRPGDSHPVEQVSQPFSPICHTHLPAEHRWMSS